VFCEIGSQIGVQRCFSLLSAEVTRYIFVVMVQIARRSLFGRFVLTQNKVAFSQLIFADLGL
jgi:hypothetical protein